MASNHDSTKGICILSLDSGGPGTYSQLLILKEYMARLAMDKGASEDEVYPGDYFDLIGGVGFGGLVALMLGHFRMNITQAIDRLLDVVSSVFPEGSQQAPDIELNAKRLKDAIEGMLIARQIPLTTKMNDRNHPQTGCKVVLYAATSASVDQTHSFRTYSHRGSSLNPTIVEAVCATISVPSHFSPVNIGPQGRVKKFVGGPLGVNNPTRELLKEAGAVFGNEARMAQISSLGCGILPTLSLEDASDEVGVGRLLKEMETDCRMVAKDLSTRFFTVEAYLRLTVDKGMAIVGLDDWNVNVLGGIETHTESYLEGPGVTKAVDISVRCVQSKVGTITLGRLNQSSSITVAAKTAPAVSAHFVLRIKPWGIMVHHLVTSPPSRQSIFPITGMGGCGKTQMVSYFLQEYPSLFTRTVYVDAGSSASIKADMQAWARKLGDGHELDVWEDAFQTLSTIPQDERWALILDNVDDPKLKLIDFVPKNVNLTVIITSRNRDLGDLSTTHHLELGGMEEDEALSTLLNAAHRVSAQSTKEMESARTLMKELGYLALALAQAGAYCNQLSSTYQGEYRPYTFTQYLSLFYSHRAKLLKEGLPSPLDNYERGVYTTLDLSYDAISETDREFLHFISFFHHANIPVVALAAAASGHFIDKVMYLARPESHEVVVSNLERMLCTGRKWDELQVHHTIRALRGFSLLSVASIDDSIFLQLHPLVQTWSRDMVPSSKQYRDMAIQCLTCCAGTGDEDNMLYRDLLPHMLDVLAQIEPRDLHVNDLMVVGKVFNKLGHYRKATELVEAALEKVTGVDGYDLGIKAGVASWLALMYLDGGKWDEAERLKVEVLEQWRRILGMEHPNTILAASNLALTYSKQGRNSEAETLRVEVLEQWRRILGMEHPNTILAASNLAVTYSNQGRNSEAETLQVEVLEQRRRILGMEHPNTILAASNLAVTYSNQGRNSEAETLQVEVLEHQRRILGMEHPDTILAAWNLAGTYLDQGRNSEAETLQVEVLEQQRRILGMEHPDTILSASNLALTYSKQGRYSEAETLQVEVLEQQRRILGMEHPNTILAASNLALTYSKQGRYSEAETLQVEVLEQQRRILGMEHPKTILAASNLAGTYSEQGRYSEAETLQLEVLEQWRRILGMEHPNTILAASNLALTYSNQGRHGEAETLQVEVLEQRRRILGMEHPNTILAASNLAATYSKQGRYSEAETLQVEVLEQGRRILGMEHPNTILAASNLAGTYSDQGRNSEAETLRVEVLEQWRRILGMEHPNTILAASNLAGTYLDQGRNSEAETLQVEVLEQRRRILGMEHPDTILAASNLAVTYWNQNRWEESVEPFVLAAQLSLKVLGRQHPDTQTRIANLEFAYKKLGKLQEARETRALLLDANQATQSERVGGIDRSKIHTGGRAKPSLLPRFRRCICLG